MKDGDFVLTESVAMLRYLAREKQVEFVLGPPAPHFINWMSSSHDLGVHIVHLMTLDVVQVADHWYPKESQAQARVDEYLEWQHLGTRSIFQKGDQVHFYAGSTAPTTSLRGG